MSDRPFRFRHPVEVRFKDIDVGGHAHHSHALVYFEEARAAYWRQVVAREGVDGIDYILAEVTVRYHRRVLWPQRLSVGVRVSRLSRTSFDMEYEVRGEDDELLVSGSTVQVMYDYGELTPKRVPRDVREAVEEHDGAFDRRGRPAGGATGDGGV